MTDEKTSLLAKRDELKARIEAINRDYRRGLDADSEERAVQLENAEVLDGIAQAAADQLEEIERKLKEL